MVIAIVIAVIVVLTVAGVLVSRSRSRPRTEPAAAPPGDSVCPACGHGFRRPDITIVTEEQVRRYGAAPVQCPQCRHIWDCSVS